MDRRAAAFENIFGRPSPNSARKPSSSSLSSSSSTATTQRMASTGGTAGLQLNSRPPRPAPSLQAAASVSPPPALPPTSYAAATRQSPARLPSRPLNPSSHHYQHQHQHQPPQRHRVVSTPSLAPPTAQAPPAPYTASAAYAYTKPTPHFQSQPPPQPQPQPPPSANGAGLDTYSSPSPPRLAQFDERRESTTSGTASTSASGDAASTSALSMGSAAAMYQTPSYPLTDPSTQASVSASVTASTTTDSGGGSAPSASAPARGQQTPHVLYDCQSNSDSDGNPNPTSPQTYRLPQLPPSYTHSRHPSSTQLYNEASHPASYRSPISNGSSRQSSLAWSSGYPTPSDTPNTAPLSLLMSGIPRYYEPTASSMSPNASRRVSDASMGWDPRSRHPSFAGGDAISAMVSGSNTLPGAGFHGHFDPSHHRSNSPTPLPPQTLLPGGLRPFTPSTSNQSTQHAHSTTQEQQHPPDSYLEKPELPEPIPSDWDALSRKSQNFIHGEASESHQATSVPAALDSIPPPHLTKLSVLPAVGGSSKVELPLAPPSLLGDTTLRSLQAPLDAASAYTEGSELEVSYSGPLPAYAPQATTDQPSEASLKPAPSQSSRTTSIQSSLLPFTDPGQASEHQKHHKSKSASAGSLTPLVYPALVSQVAQALKDRVVVSERSKDGLRYKDAFDGQDAVDKLCQILRTKDRNLALLLGRSLDAQKFFHDVTYDHRLRDSASEVYQFRVRLAPAGAPTLSYPSDEGQTIVPDAAQHTLIGSEVPTLLAAVANASSSHADASSTIDVHADPARPPPRTGTFRSTTTVETDLSSLPTPAGGDSSDGIVRSQHEQSRGARAGDATPDSPTSSSEEDDLPSGVFTLLTECYSPTCTPDNLCYSITCPRRWEQQARLKAREQGAQAPQSAPANLPPLGLVAQAGASPVRAPAGASSAAAAAMTVEVVEDDLDKVPGTLWADSVPTDVVASVSAIERKRQELLNEIVVTECNFVHDLEYLRDEWIVPLRTRHVIPLARREEFLTQLFWNVQEILSVNQQLCDALVARQKKAHVMDRVGDLFLSFVPRFEPFVRYGAHQLYGKYEFEREKASNPTFARFVDQTERRPAARKLELNGYLTKPTTRLARYPLLLDQVLKCTPDSSSDKHDLPKVMKMIKQFLSKVNAETGRSANSFNLAQLDQQLVFKPGEAYDLRLRDPMRELVFKGPLKRRAGPQSESSELQVFLFDHALLLTKAKTVNKQELFKVTRKPIPLELLVVTLYDELPLTSKSTQTGVKTTTTKLSTGQRLESFMLAGAPKQDAKQGYALTLNWLGRNGFSMTLWAPTYVARQKWMQHIEASQEALRARSNLFSAVSMNDHYFHGSNRRTTCAVPFDFGRRIIYGTQDGVYLSELRERARNPIKVLPLSNVTQIDVLEEYQILIVLADRTLHTYMLDTLDPQDPLGNLKRGKRIHGMVTFFRAGTCLGRTLVCLVKSSPVPSSTIRTLEPVETQYQCPYNAHYSDPIASAVTTASSRGGAGGKAKRPGLQKLLQGPPGQSEALRVFKEFYVPMESTSVHFLKSKLCLATTKGFEIVDLETLDTQALLDPADLSLEFVYRKEALKPIAIYRIHREFLLCYDDFAFYVNKTGWRAKGNWLLQWEGHPTAFALHYPYILAFDPNFIEVHHVGTGALHQVITGTLMKCLFSDVPPPMPPGQQAAMRAAQAQQAQYQQQMQMHHPLTPGVLPPAHRQPVVPVQQLHHAHATQAHAPAQAHGAPLSRPSSQFGSYSNVPTSMTSSPAHMPNGFPPLNQGVPYPVPGHQAVHPAGYSAMVGAQPIIPQPPPAVPINSMWESAHASRTHIIFSAGPSVFCVRRVLPTKSQPAMSRSTVVQPQPAGQAVPTGPHVGQGSR